MENTMYREEILELYKHPMNFGSLDTKTHSAHKHNPTCGDDVTVDLEINGDSVSDVKFYGSGCAICMASSSLLTETIKNKTKDEIMYLDIDDVVKLLGIPVSPGRVKCATLCLETIKQALQNNE